LRALPDFGPERGGSLQGASQNAVQTLQCWRRPPFLPSRSRLS
jgi:hypothetical protein